MFQMSYIVARLSSNEVQRWKVDMAYMEGCIANLAVAVLFRCAHCTLKRQSDCRVRAKAISLMVFGHYANWSRLFTSVTALNTNAEPLKNGLFFSTREDMNWVSIWELQFSVVLELYLFTASPHKVIICLFTLIRCICLGLSTNLMRRLEAAC